MDVIGLLIRLGLIAACLLAAGVSTLLLAVLGMIRAGDGTGTRPIRDHDYWERTVGEVLAAVGLVISLIVAFGIVWDMLGLTLE